MDTEMLIGSKFETGTRSRGADPQPEDRGDHPQPARGLAGADRGGGDRRRDGAFAHGRAPRRPARRLSAEDRGPHRGGGRGVRRARGAELRQADHAVLNDEMPAIVDCYRFFAGAVRSMPGVVAGEYLPGHTSMVRRDPIGVVASIAPWNYPLMMMAWKLAPAIAGGNTVVFKPSEQTPLTALKLARILAEVLPEGVVNVVLGRGDSVGNALISHPQGRHDLDHRRCRHRQEGAAGRGQVGQAHASGARRQGAGHRLRRRRPRGRGQRPARLRLLQCRPGLHRRLPHLCRQEDLREAGGRPLLGRVDDPATAKPTTPRTRSGR